MNFASFPYLLFLGAILILYFNTPTNWRTALILIASYAFYATFGVGFLILMVLTTCITFATARLSYDSITPHTRMAAFITGLLLDLSVFVAFKYFHFIDPFIMNWPGLSMHQLLIPVGISFYTFKTLGYCIDVYKRKYTPESSIINYAASVAFFPQLIAGPIEKSHTIIEQLKKMRPFEQHHITEGAKLILWGLFKKLVIADSIAQIINPVIDDPYSFGSWDLTLAFMAFIYQIYTDFSGYSDIAIGSARCFGIELPANFNKPFFARNIFDFWRRWHISFYRWFKEYVYENLFKFNRKSAKIVTALRLGLVFVLVGLWHGASFNYFLYAMAAYFWVLLDFSSRNFRRTFFASIRKRKFIIRALSYLGITIMVASMSIFFRSNSVEDAIYIYGQLFADNIFKLGYIKLLYILLLIVLFELMQALQTKATGHCFEKINLFYLRGLLYAGMSLLLILVSSRPDVTFQYFQF